MSAIIIGPCPGCISKTGLTLKERKLKANPDCPKCKGSGIIEINREKRLEEDRKMEEILDKADAMFDEGINEEEMSDEEFEKWKPGDKWINKKPQVQKKESDIHGEILKHFKDKWS